MKCLCCRIGNAYRELEKHPSETALRSLERLWYSLLAVDVRQINSVVTCPLHDDTEKIMAVIDGMAPKMRRLATEGIMVRRLKPVSAGRKGEV